MILSLTSNIFISLLLSGKLFMNASKNIRRYLFLIINIVLYAAYLKSIISAAGILLFVIPTFLYVNLMKRRSLPIWPMIIIVLGLFICLNGDIFVLFKASGISKLATFKLLGLSYILFRQLDILVQMSSGFITKIDIVDYLNYLFSFWTLLAGPIQRYNEFIVSFYKEKVSLDDREIFQCLNRAANGMLKVLILGTFFKDLVDTALKSYALRHYVSYSGNPFDLLILNNYNDYKCFFTLFYCYPLYVYFNFSGYCDVVIAMGRWVGFSLPENFNKPYLSRNVIEFWNRYHITLSNYLRDMVFQPLFKFLISGWLSKHVLKAQYLSIFITFTLMGIWHGLTVNFVIYGLLQGIGMAFSMYYRDSLLRKYGKQWYKKEYTDNKVIAFFERFICLHYYCFSLMFFLQ